MPMTFGTVTPTWVVVVTDDWVGATSVVLVVVVVVVVLTDFAASLLFGGEEPQDAIPHAPSPTTMTTPALLNSAPSMLRIISICP
jgi:hypothetical protein